MTLISSYYYYSELYSVGPWLEDFPGFLAIVRLDLQLKVWSKELAVQVVALIEAGDVLYFSINAFSNNVEETVVLFDR